MLIVTGLCVESRCGEKCSVSYNSVICMGYGTATVVRNTRKTSMKGWVSCGKLFIHLTLVAGLVGIRFYSCT